ncbi:MAG: alpha/beta hydrolase, partial [Acidobacteria bacterium]|nr:alpha/beta hydrolase [Acidobacteriota bacterium]
MGLIALAFATVAGMHAPVQPAPAATEFTVFLRGAPVGTVEATVDRSAAGIVISGTTRLGPPLAVNVRRAEVRYDPGWKPLEFTLDAFVRNQAFKVRTTFGGGTATSEVTLIDKTSTKTDPVTPDTIVLSNSFYGTYEALAARLAAARAGSEVRAYITPQAELTVKVIFVTEERLQVPGRTVVTRHFQLVLENPGAPIEADLWSDRDGRLVRFSVPGESLDIVRADVATVAARRETVARSGDQSVTIPANGFVLAATISRPAAVPTARKAKLPAVVLVSGSEPTDRDATVSNVPIFAQIAGALADAGFLVVRYDKRGVGQSGGRIEAATIADYADDAVAVTRYLEKRKDVDRRRIAVVGYGEGGWIALVAGSRNSGIAALALVATAGTTGAELMLERQRHALERLQIPDAEKLAK